MTTAFLPGTGRLPTQLMRRYDRPVPTVPRQSDCEALDLAFAAGRAPLREVYDAHGSLVYSICRRSLDAEAAKDVAQEVFLSAWKGRHQFDPERGALAAWLTGITKRRIIDHLRSEGRHADRRADADAATPTTESPVERIADSMLVADGLRRLPEDARQFVELAFVQGLTHQEISELTGTPLGTVKSSIRRGLQRVKSHLESTHV
jgi:RNA polymerase sigma factor (sigma-70 family)